MTLLTEPKWNGDHALALRTFLESPAGRVFVSRMEWLRPGYTPRGDATQRLVESGIQEGYDLFHTTMASLVVIPEKPETPPSENYPDLDAPLGAFPGETVT